MARLFDRQTGAEITMLRATTHNSVVSYGKPVWADADGTAYCQVGLDNPQYLISLDVEEQKAALGDMIRRRRNALGLTLQDLSLASGVAVSNLSKLERGGASNTDTIARIASALGASVTIE